MVNLRLRGPYGQATLNGLDPDLNVGQLQDLLVAHTGVVVEDQEILIGYPPKLLDLPLDGSDKTIEELGFADGDMVTVRTRDGGAAPSMAQRGRSISATRSLSRNSMRSSKSFSKNLSPSMQSLNEEAALSDQLMSTPLDEDDPMFSDSGSAFSPRPPRPIGRSISQGDVLAADAAFAASLDNPHSAGPVEDAATATAAVPLPNSSAPRRKRVAASRRDPYAEDQGVPFGARPEPPANFGDWANAPDADCACVNCLLAQRNVHAATAPHARMEDHIIIARRVVDDDNSCLFTAVAYIMEGFRSKGPQLRQVIAEAVTTDPSTYNEAFLGKPPQEYAKWILDPSKWGGAIELSILSKYYKREIAAYDIKTLRCDVYGEGNNYRERGMVIYDGLHYDALSIAAFEHAPEEIDVSVFDPLGPQGAPAHRGATEIARQAQKEKLYTDTATFTLRCQICQVGVQGEKEALDHAKASGHAAFAEYNSQANPGSPKARLRSMNSFNSRIRVGAGV